MGQSLLDKVWQRHTVRELDSGQTQLLIGLHLLHEVTSPQAFEMLNELGLPVKHPERTFATIDHVVPTDCRERPFADELAEEMTAALTASCARHGIKFYDLPSGDQGVIHIVGPDQGLTQPGMTIACGDSHTATHGAFGALAFGIGTSQIRDVLATQSLAMAKPKLRQVRVDGAMPDGVTAKDVILAIIARLGVKGGVGYAYEYAGSTFDAMSMEERLTVCNMSIEGGARIGYVNPDQTTFDYLRGRPMAPADDVWDQAEAWWREVASDADAEYDDVQTFDATALEPMVTWGINPGQAIGISARIPRVDELPAARQKGAREALDYMKLEEGASIKGTPIDVVFIGSCTNGRISDLRAAAEVLKGRKVAAGVRTLVVPGSGPVARQAEEEGLDQVFKDAGCDWREPGCSMCLAMNPDKLQGDEISASTSNRNFKGRQGSPTGRTVLVSPAMAAAAAITGELTDIREL